MSESVKVYSVGCNHVYDLKPGGQELYHFVIENPVDKRVTKLEKEWKNCPICGKEILFASQ